MANEPANMVTEDTPSWSDKDAVEALLERAGGGDRSTVPALRTLFASADRDPSLLAAYGSAPKWLREEITSAAAGKNVAIEIATKQTLEETSRELEGPNPSPLERLLAERAAICWFLVNRYEYLYSASDGLSLKQADFRQRLIDRAHARLLSALKTLATVRKLAVPALQVNIGANQINSLGASSV